jgi:C-terminal processing protease CtpA/Prc
MRLSTLRRRALTLSLAALATGLVATSTTGCSSHHETGMSSDEIRTISTAEALDDFDQIASAFRTLYGAMERKQSKYGFDFETMTKQYRNQLFAARTEGEVAGIFIEYVSQFKDPHVYLDRQIVDDASQGHWLPFAVQPVEDTYLVNWLDPTAPADKIHIGDELMSIDGQSTADLAAMFSKYFAVANPLASKSITAGYLTSRASYLPGMINSLVPAKVHLRGADGVERDVTLPWNATAHLLTKPPPVPPAGGSVSKQAMSVSKTALTAIAASNASDDGKTPFFMTDASKQSLENFTPAKPSADSLAKVKLDQAAADAVSYFAATYTTGGKKVLFLRLPAYTPDKMEDALAYIQALFDTYQPQVDALVFDETHNPGGNVFFAQMVVSLLAKAPYNDYVEQLHADRKWMKSLSDEATQLNTSGSPQFGAIFMDQARTVESAYDSGKTLSAPVPFVTGATTNVPDPMAWQKPSMMLIDELSVSCADFVPLLVKANHMATLFGQTTMGGGGNVEEVATLNNTQITLSLSRGLATVFDPTGAYPEANEIEDNGVKPDVVYNHTVADVRGGYVGYLKAMNAALLDTIAAAPKPAPAPTPAPAPAPTPSGNTNPPPAPPSK